MGRHPNPPKPLGPWLEIEELELARDVARTDLWFFFLYAFGAGLNPKGDKWIDHEIHYPIVQWLQQHIDEWFENREKGRREQKHLALVIPREMGKTTLMQAVMLWISLRDPDASIYIGSERLDLSSKILDGCKAVLDGSDPYAMFPKLYGNWATAARSWTGRQITHAARKNTSRKDPSFGTFAVETSIVGAHPDVWVEDDPNSYERLTTDTNWLNTVNSQVSSMIPVIQADGLVIWPGTRYDDGDHFGTAFVPVDEGGDGVATLTGMPTDSIKVDPKGKWHVYFLAARDQDGKPTCEKVWPERRLADYERRDPLKYASQVLNNPSESATNPITRDQIRQCIVKHEDVPWASLVYGICCDTAFNRPGSHSGKDWSVFVIHGYPKNGSGDVYVVECHGSPQWRAEEFGDRLVAKVQQYRQQGKRIVAISDELHAGLGDIQRTYLMNRFNDAGQPMPYMHLWNRQKGLNKVQRIKNATKFWVDGHVRVVENAPGVGHLMEQMARVGQFEVNPALKKDFADAHSDAFMPEFYQPMRRPAKQSPYGRDASAIQVEGLNRRIFEDDEYSQWRRDNPREPLTNR